jgi:TonB family protein
MKTHFVRFFFFCLLSVLSTAVLVLPVVSQEAKPDEASKKNILRAGVNGIGVPACVYCPPPNYSEKAKADKLQGSVVLDVAVTPEGKATKVLLIRGLGEGLDEKAIEAVKSWRFRPAKDSTGKPVEVRVPVEVSFRLSD